jgi:hypothetical protein
MAAARSTAPPATLKTPLYFFGWPGFVGGADTKMAHLLELIHRHYQITLVANDSFRLKEKVWTKYLDRLGIRYCVMKHLPRKIEGLGVGLCNPRFFKEKIAHRAKEKGLKIIWSSEMMWHHEGELDAVKEKIVDKVLYVSNVQKRWLSPGYGDLPWAMTGNFVNPKDFPFQHRRHTTFCIGRLSRAAPEKYPEDFPVFYECLELPETRFRVMAWDKRLAEKYRWHKFDHRWELLPEVGQPQVEFLHSLDLFVYPLGHYFTESWGRSTVEAMLTGCIPLVPPGHHLDHLIKHGHSGFICHDFQEYKEHAHRLYFDLPYRQRMAKQCRRYAEEHICNRTDHLRVWKEALS